MKNWILGLAALALTLPVNAQELQIGRAHV